MSRSFIGFGQKAYIGQPSTRAVKLGGIAAQVVPLLFQWLSYGASSNVNNINVGVDLQTVTCRALDQIRSIYIDNLGSANPVYVYFPDTGETLAAKANSEGWYPCFTNSKKLWVVGEGFLTGSIPTTFILITNVPQVAAVNTELDQAVSLFAASPVISRGTSIYNSIYGVPALGDILAFSPQLDLTAGGNVQPLFNTPQPSGFLYLTNLKIVLTDFRMNAGSQPVQIFIESTGIAGVLIAPVFIAVATAQANPQIPIELNLTGMQVKLDATQTWRVRNLFQIDHGTCEVYSTLTIQP